MPSGEGRDKVERNGGDGSVVEDGVCDVVLWCCVVGLDYVGLGLV